MKRLKYLWTLAALIAVLFGMVLPSAKLSVKAAEPDWPQIKEETFRVSDGIRIRQFNVDYEELGELDIVGSTIENYLNVKEDTKLCARIVGKITLYIGDQKLAEDWDCIELGEWSEKGWATYETTTTDYGVYKDPFDTNNILYRSDSIHCMSIAYDTGNDDFPDVIYELEIKEGFHDSDHLNITASAEWAERNVIQMTVISSQDAEIFYQVSDAKEDSVSAEQLALSEESQNVKSGTNTVWITTKDSKKKYIYLVGKDVDGDFGEVTSLYLAEQVFPTYPVSLYINKITYIKIDGEELDISSQSTDRYCWSHGNRAGLDLYAVPEGSVVEVGVANVDADGRLTGKVLEGAAVRQQDADTAELTGYTENSFSFKVKGHCWFYRSQLTWKDPEDARNVIRTETSGKSYTGAEIESYVSVRDSSGNGTVMLEKSEKARTMTALAYADDAYRYSFFDYRFKEWRAQGIELDEEQKTANPLTFEMPQNDIVLEAVFEDAGVLVTVEQTNPLAGTAYIVSGTYVNCDTSIRLKEGISVAAKVRDYNSSFDLSWKLVCDGADISDQMQNGSSLTVQGSSMTLTPVFVSKYLADIEVVSGDEAMGTVSAKVGTGSAGAILNAVMPGQQVTLTARPMNRYRLKSWTVTDSYGAEIDVTPDASDKNAAVFTVPELTKNITITASAEFEIDPSQISSENAIESIELLDKNGVSLGMADRDRTNFIISLPEDADEEIVRKITSGECSLKVEASDYSSVKLGEYDAKPAEEWKSGISYAMLVDSDMLIQVIAEDGSTQDYVLKIKLPKSSEKEITEVSLLDKDTKNVLYSGTLSGSDWTIALPDTLTAEEAGQLVYGGAYLKVVASDKASVAQEGSYDDKGQADSWGSGKILCYMDLNNTVKFTVTAEDGSTQEYTITITHTEPDPDKPVLEMKSVERTSDTAAKISFTTNMAGKYYYKIVDSGAAAPSFDGNAAGIDAKKGTVNMSPSGLTAGTKYLYIWVKSTDGAVSDALIVAIPAYDKAETMYKIGLSYPTAGGTITVSSTSAKAGETITVTVTPKTGKRLVPGSLKYSESTAGGAVVNIDETTLKFTMPASEISISCTWEDDTSDTPSTSEKAITTFMINGVTGTVNDTAGTISITLPNGTDLTSLSPVIGLGDDVKSISPASGKAVDLSKPVTYTVTMKDGTTKQYTVTAYMEAPPKSEQLWDKMLENIGGNTSSSGSGTWWEKAKKEKKKNEFPSYW